jgi:hypothetical protein
MTPVHFAEVTGIAGANQEEYLPLPFHMGPKPEVIMTTCWELTDEEIEQLKISKRIWLQQFTFGQTIQPQRPSTEYPDMPV